jgi:hypothetical protein
MLWGVISLIEESTFDPKNRKYELSGRGKWFWFPSMYIGYTGDLFWERKARGDWYTLFDLNAFELYSDGPKGRHRMSMEGYSRLNPAFGATGPGELVRGDTLSTKGEDSTGGRRLALSWLRIVSMPPEVRG